MNWKAFQSGFRNVLNDAKRGMQRFVYKLQDTMQTVKGSLAKTFAPSSRAAAVARVRDAWLSGKPVIKLPAENLRHQEIEKLVEASPFVEYNSGQGLSFAGRDANAPELYDLGETWGGYKMNKGVDVGSPEHMRMMAVANNTAQVPPAYSTGKSIKRAVVGNTGL